MTARAAAAPGSSRRFALALAAVAALQSAVLAWMIADQAMLLRGGREIALVTVPVDPRSLFQGDYVILRYEISEVEAALAGGAALREGDTVYVTLARGEEGGWRAAGVNAEHPGSRNGDRVVLRGVVASAGGERLGIDYGIERYFVPEGEGRRLEQLVGSDRLEVLAAIGDDGRTAIKGLMVEGRLQYEEPLF